MARKTRCSPELQEDLLKLIRAGLPLHWAAKARGIEPRTIRNWVTWGREGTNATTPPREPYRSFVVALEKALATPLARAINVLNKSMEEGDAATARWLLATRYPADFGQRARHEISGVDGGPIETSNVGGIIIQAIPEDEGDEPKALPQGMTTFLVLPPKDPPEGTPEAIALDERRMRARAAEAPLRRRAIDEPDEP
jgi:hypothetical protein